MEHQAEAVGTASTRLGPRPLPLHLAIATMTWLSSRGTWPLWSSASPLWRPELRPQMQALDAALEGVERKAFTAALESETRARFDRLAAGIESYRRHPFRRSLPELPVLWQDGTTRLLDYRAGPTGGPVVLAVPSLINRAHILDLTADRSPLRALAAAGTRPLLVDWGAPGDLERGFTLTDYIAGRLEQALDRVLAEVGRPVVLLGYCMGGLLTVALALRRRRDLSGLVCLATPWDFHAERPSQAKLLGASLGLVEPLLRNIGELPVDAIQALFAGLDPLPVIRKFAGFAALDQDSERARLFVAVEDWLNDGVPLAAPVARECVAGWYGANTPATGEWRVAGEAVQPALLDLPSLVVIPDQDRIVPPASAEALAAVLPRAEALRPAAGHIGMIVGGGALDRLYQPLIAWLSRLDPGHWRRRG
jgi:poly[(R)-3-hydroxyalkanoate] polymerase subunit PhaC